MSISTTAKDTKKSTIKFASSSVLDTKETLLHFRSDSDKGTSSQKNSFLTTHYRFRNLQLADNLENSIFVDHDEVNKTIRNLRWCSSLAMIEHTPAGASILKSSKSCKNPHCAICARAKANKLTQRLLKAITDKENEHLFRNKYFYFLTLTLKHNSETRTGIYLDELKECRKKLLRSKMYRSYFPPKVSGAITGTECTLTENGYHIHNHMLIAAPRLQGHKITQVEAAIRAKWLKISGDSSQIRLDLVKISKDDIALAMQGDGKSKSLKPIREVFKYSIKAGSLKGMSAEKCDLYGAWIIETKGKNFVNASGIFRGLQLTGAKSKYDEKAGEPQLQENASYYIGKLTDVYFNKSAKSEYSRKGRQLALQKIHLRKLGASFEDVTAVASDMLEYLRAGRMTDAVLDMYLQKWVTNEKAAAAERERYTSEISEEANTAAVLRQFELFEKKKEPEGWKSERF